MSQSRSSRRNIGKRKQCELRFPRPDTREDTLVKQMIRMKAYFEIEVETPEGGVAIDMGDCMETVDAVLRGKIGKTPGVALGRSFSCGHPWFADQPNDEGEELVRIITHYEAWVTPGISLKDLDLNQWAEAARTVLEERIKSQGVEIDDSTDLTFHAECFPSRWEAYEDAEADEEA